MDRRAIWSAKPENTRILGEKLDKRLEAREQYQEGGVKNLAITNRSPEAINCQQKGGANGSFSVSPLFFVV